MSEEVPVGPRKYGGGKRGRKNPNQLLQDLRWVYRNPEAATTSPARVRLQELFNSKPSEFLNQMRRAEEAHKKLAILGSTKAQGGVTTTEGPDEGVERIKELVMSEWEQVQTLFGGKG